MGPGWEEVAILRGAFNRGQAVSQPRLDELCGRWIEWADPKGQETESLVLVDGLGRRLEPVRQAPRWLCHLLALRHRAVHVLMSWDSPKLGRMFVCQVRSWTKRDYPGFIDISVGGHVVGLADPRQSALAEMQEEMGVGPSDLVAGELTLVGGYDCTLKLTTGPSMTPSGATCTWPGLPHWHVSASRMGRWWASTCARRERPGSC